MIGWVFGAFLLLMAGIYFTAYNLNYGYPLFRYTLSSITFLFLIVSPILAMRTLAEERKQKTDQLLLTAPVTVWQIVLGKYLALIVTFLLPVVILCFYPLIMAQYGSIAFASTYVALLGFFCLDVPAWLWDCSSRLLRKARFLPQSEPLLFCWYVI